MLTLKTMKTIAHFCDDERNFRIIKSNRKYFFRVLEKVQRYYKISFEFNFVKFGKDRKRWDVFHTF